MTQPRGRTSARRLWAERGAARLVGAGGLAVVASLAGILVFLLVEVAPLLGSSTLGAPSPLAGGEVGARALLVDPHRTHLAELGEDGFARLTELETGRERARRRLLDGADPSLLRGVPEDRLLIAADRAGRVRWLRVDWPLRYEGRERVVEPRLSGVEALDLELSGSELLDYALRADPDGASWVGALSSGEVAVVSIETRTNAFSGETRRQTTETRFEVDGRIGRIAIGPERRYAYAATLEGELLSWALDRPSAPERVELPGRAGALAPLLGGRSLIAGLADGRLIQYFRAPGPDGGTPLTRIREFPGLSGPVFAIAPSQRDRSFFAADRGGEIALFHSTTGQRLWSGRAPSGELFALGLAPRANALYVAGSAGTAALEVHNPHPEAGGGGFFGRIWYEDYPRPEYVWQSTGGSDEFEPKLSLVPLLVGTLKGTLYTLLLSVPLGLLGAIYVSQFMHPNLQGVVKPTVEIMASLPSVVLGFVAGLWLAPRLEAFLPGMLAMLFVLPALSIAAGSLWRALPARWTHGRHEGSELVLYLAVLVLGAAVCLELSPSVERAVFGGSVSTWLRETTGLVYDQRNAIVAGIAMGFAVIPIILSLADDALSNVPPDLSAGSLALGATRWQTVARIVLPAASPGIFAAVMIGLGRAVGETMIVLMATGNTPLLDWSAFNGFRTLSANIAVEIPEAPRGGTLYRTLFLAALVLFALTFTLNTAAELVRERLRRRFADD
ncbi:MAG: ABC transporter permease subunit [Proteobacteria bacterium]|nr:ABC transporter permease subunit [Pseudomonadota bacterium]